MASARAENMSVGSGDGIGSPTARRCYLDGARVRRPRAAFALALAFVLDGCSLFQKYKMSDIERAPTYSAPTVVQKGIVIGAVACARPQRISSETSAEALAATLRERILEESPKMTVLTPDTVELALGAEKYHAWTKQLQDTGIVRTDCFPEIRSKLPDSVHYVLLARVQWDHVSTNIEKHDEVVGGVKQRVEYYVTTRSTAMLFQLYDLETGMLEWKGTGDTINDNSQRGFNRDRVDKILDRVFPEDVDPRYPACPPIETQMGQINKVLVESLLRDKK